MADVTLTIDGIQLTVPKGTTVLEAAEKAGIFIPTLCHDPELSKPGACRICVVEIPGAHNLQASCVTEVAEGMVVYTASPAVIEPRKTNLELLLANHPGDCLTCHKNGECRLQQYAYYYGVSIGAFKGEKQQHPLEDDNPFIARDMNKCILCGKCVRMCEEVQGNNVIDFAFRGFFTKVGPAMDTTLSDTDISNCVFCGNCIAACPVGALTEKAMIGKGRTWEMEKVTTTCPYCGAGCSFDLNVKDGKVYGATSTEGDVNGRAMCVKGHFGYGFIHHPDASILYTMGLTQHICGTHNFFAVDNLTMLCGQIGKESSGVNPLRGRNNVQGACDMGALPVFFPAYLPVTVEGNRAKFAAAWGVKELPELPPHPGLTVGEIIEESGK